MLMGTEARIHSAMFAEMHDHGSERHFFSHRTRPLIEQQEFLCVMKANCQDLTPLFPLIVNFDCATFSRGNFVLSSITVQQCKKFVGGFLGANVNRLSYLLRFR